MLWKTTMSRQRSQTQTSTAILYTDRCPFTPRDTWWTDTLNTRIHLTPTLHLANWTAKIQGQNNTNTNENVLWYSVCNVVRNPSHVSKESTVVRSFRTVTYLWTDGQIYSQTRRHTFWYMCMHIKRPNVKRVCFSTSQPNYKQQVISLPWLWDRRTYRLMYRLIYERMDGRDSLKWFLSQMLIYMYVCMNVCMFVYILT